MAFPEYPARALPLSRIAAFLLMLHFALFHSLLSGFVLCLGSDGHLALESSIDKATCRVNPGEISGLPAFHASTCAVTQADHCGNCQDLSLNTGCGEKQARPSFKVQKFHPTFACSPSDPGPAFAQQTGQPAHLLSRLSGGAHRGRDNRYGTVLLI